MDDEYPFAPLVAYLRPENLVLAPPEDDSDEVTAIFLLLFGLAFGLLVYWYYFYDPSDPAVPEWVRKNVKASKDVELPAWLRDRLPVLTTRKATKTLGGEGESSSSSAAGVQAGST